MSRAKDLAELLDANGDVKSSALDNTSSDLVDDASPQLGADLSTNGNDINFGDNDKAQFGAGNDLQIYHDGSNSYVHENGTGSLNVLASDQIKLGNSANDEVYAKFNANGNVELRHNNSVKLETTSTGVDVTGRITTDSIIEDASGNVGIGQAPSNFSGWRNLEMKGDSYGALINFENSSGTRIHSIASQTDKLRIQSVANHPVVIETNNIERFRINGDGTWGKAPSGTVVGVRIYEYAVRTVMPATANHVWWNINDTKLLGSESKIIVNAQVVGHSNSAGSLGTYIQYDGTKSYSLAYTYDGTPYMKNMTGVANFTGKASGTRNLRLGWTSNGGAQRPFVTWNPNSSDDGRYSQMKSVITVYEVIA